MVNSICTAVCRIHVIIFVFYRLVRAGVIVDTGSDSRCQSICTASICQSLTRADHFRILSPSTSS